MFLAREFELKSFTILRWNLCVQRKYTPDLLKETRMLGNAGQDTPMESNVIFGTDKDSPPTNKGRYRRMVGRLIYLTHTRLDIGFAVSVASRHVNDPKEAYMKSINYIPQYLKKAPKTGLHF